MLKPKLLQKCATTIAHTAGSRAIAAHGTRVARGSAVRIEVINVSSARVMRDEVSGRSAARYNHTATHTRPSAPEM